MGDPRAVGHVRQLNPPSTEPKVDESFASERRSRQRRGVSRRRRCQTNGRRRRGRISGAVAMSRDPEMTGNDLAIDATDARPRR